MAGGAIQSRSMLLMMAIFYALTAESLSRITKQIMLTLRTHLI